MIFEEADNTISMVWPNKNSSNMTCNANTRNVPWPKNIDVHWPFTDRFLTSWIIPETAGASQPVGSLLHLQCGTLSGNRT